MKKLRQKLYRYRFEILCVILALLLLQTAVYWKNHPDSPYVTQMLLFFSLGASAVTLYLLLRLLWRSKWAKAVASAARAVLAGASALFVKLLDKWNASKWNIFGRRRGYVGGNTTVTFDFFTGEPKKAKKIKPPKWKHMQTEREKLGYLYYHLIVSLLKRGFCAKRTDTPSELKRRAEQAERAEPETRVFDLYIGARYDERAVLKEKELDELKETLFKKKS